MLRSRDSLEDKSEKDRRQGAAGGRPEIPQGEGEAPGGEKATVRPTIIERVNMSVPLPYAVSCLLVAALLGPLGFFILNYLATLDLARAGHSILYSTSGPYSFLQLLGNNLGYPALAFYCAYMIRYMRMTINSVEPDLVRLSPEWKETIQRSFGRISHNFPPIAITAAIVLLLSPLLASQFEGNSTLNQVYLAATYPVFFYGIGTFIWAYAIALWGLGSVGRRPLKLRSYHEDRLLGLGGFGSISLSLALVFFMGVILGTLLVTAFASDLPPLMFALFEGFLIVIGLGMFFLPLRNIHGMMARERERVQASIMKDTVTLAGIDGGTDGGRESEPRALARALLLEHYREDVERISLWPFDAPVLGRLIILVLAIVASFIAHLILVSLSL